ncbi:urease accessory protein UreF [Paenibacillus roseipurpureus]|uniref:Urease accessory protein UreF n=1 Tax=Paenibacillus roseopurpureus TaxID=2918901 RepID=A0AA96LT54_9BACL|nr:urease accessory protein UreF [Paenibacillus sp. MBLB1832]WNR45609.1 urease accessory protein UreF [Paenibacillus sp. MBLB1832]
MTVYFNRSIGTEDPTGVNKMSLTKSNKAREVAEPSIEALIRQAPLSAPNNHWLAYQQLLDSALPIGGFSHSFGLETLVQQERLTTLSELEAYIRGMLAHNWASSDVMVIKALYTLIPRHNLAGLWELNKMLHVQRVGSESRSGVQKMGRRLLGLARAMYPDLNWEPLEDAIRTSRCSANHPIVHGWVSYHLGVSLEQAAEGYLYTCVMTCINSALRLMSIGQTQGQTLLAKLIPVIGQEWQRVAQMDPLDAYTNSPAADLAMMQHETLYSRLFMS